MKHVLVIGAGNFGKHLIAALLESGCAVDVLDREAAPGYEPQRLGCRVIWDNAWNISGRKDIHFSDYECCYLCMPENQPLNLHVIESLRKMGAGRIVVRVKHAREAEFYLRVGANQVICPEQFASRSLVREIAGYPGTDSPVFNGT